MQRDVSQCLDERNAARFFCFFMLGHLVLWILVPFLTEPNISLDALEMVSWGQEWQAGYHKHPPFPAWVAQASVRLLGTAAWPTLLASQLCVLTCLWAAWQLGREFLRPWQAVCAAIMLAASHYYTFTSPEFNNNIVSRATWALAILFLYRALTRSSLQSWLMAGLCLGLGMLSKYDTAILAVAMLAFGILDTRARVMWQTRGPWLMLAAALATVTPHVLWLAQNEFTTITYAMQRSDNHGGHSLLNHVINPGRFLVTQFVAVGPIALLGAFLASWPWRLRKIEIADTFKRDFLLCMVLGPPLIIATISLLTGIRIRSMWGSALWTYTGVALLYLFETRNQWPAVRNTIYACASVSILWAGVLATNNVLRPYVANDGSRIHFPGRELAAEVEERWNERNYGPLRAIGGTWWTAGNASFYSTDKPSIYGSLSTRQSPWVNDESFREQGGVIVWRVGDEHDFQYEKLRRKFPGLEMTEPIRMDWNTDAALEQLEFRMAILPSATQLATRATQRVSKREGTRTANSSDTNSR